MPDVTIVLDFPPAFYRYIYEKKPVLRTSSYRDHATGLLCESYGGIADAYEMRFEQAGFSATTVIANAVYLQAQWAAEHGMQDAARQLPIIERLLASGGLARKLRPLATMQKKRLLNKVFLAQIAHFRPAVLLIRLMTSLPAEIVRMARERAQVVVGHLDTPFPAYNDLHGVYDFIFTPFPHYVRFFRECGLRCHYLPLAFEPVFLERCEERYGRVEALSHGAVFVGSVSPQHRERMRWLNALAETGQVEFWMSLDAITPEDVPPAILAHSHEPVFGLEMLDVYRRARIALNAHPEISGSYAAIFRLYETTGAGSMLLTDDRQNLAELFEPGEEVVTYSTLEESLERLNYYLEHEEERVEIAKQGRQRTLSEHLYERRVHQIIEWVEPLLM